MLTLLFLSMCGVCIWISIRHPQWFWTAVTASAALLQIGAAALHQSPTSIDIGPISSRDTDPALLGILAGSVYHIRRDRKHAQGLQFLTLAPLGIIVLGMLAFMAIKVLTSVLFRSDDIMASRIVSHSAGGLVAAIGDVRDQLLPFLPVVYAFAARRSRNLRMLGWPTVVLVAILLLKAAVGLLLPGSVSAGSADLEGRFIPSEDAISLTLFGFLLFFIPVRGLGRLQLGSLGMIALTVATLANHRSQWIAMALGLVLMLLVVVLGPPITRNPKPIRVGLAALLVLLAMLVPAGMYALDGGGASFLPSFFVKRLYAFTDPSRDPDSEWRQRLWRSRIDQVGNDWPWGRPFGARSDTLLSGRWTNVPAHSAYVSMYEVGGFIFCLLALLFWGRAVQIAGARLLKHGRHDTLWPAVMVLTTTATSLAYGSAYLFPLLGPTLAVIFALDCAPWARRTGLSTANPESSKLYTYASERTLVEGSRTAADSM